jgi:hypothetical protein
MAVIHHWVGQAAIQPQIYTVTVTTAPVATDTFEVTLTGSGRKLILTFGAVGNSTADAAEKIKNLLTSGRIINDESINIAAVGVGELRGVTAFRRGSKITIIGNQSRPLAMTFAKTGTIAFAATGTPGTETGPHHADDAENWDDGVVPVDDDEVIFDSGAIDCKYALDQIDLIRKFRRTKHYRGKIGLPSINQDALDAPYGEVLPTHLKVNGSTLGPGLVEIEHDPEDTDSYTRIDLQNKQGTIRVIETSRYSGRHRPVEMINTQATSKIIVIGGVVEIVGYGQVIYVGNDPNDTENPDVLLRGIIDSVIKAGGKMRRHDTAEPAADPGTAVLKNYGGDYILSRGVMHNMVTCQIFGGSLICNSADDNPVDSITYPDGIEVYPGGRVDFSQDSQPKLIKGPIKRYGNNALVVDPSNVVAAMEFENFGAPMSELTEMGVTGTWTRTFT